MKIDVRSELKFSTARSGGKGGQNVNKVETMVEVYFNIPSSALLNDEQKKLVLSRLRNRLNTDGELRVKAQEERTQLGNRQLAVKKINELLTKALFVPKKRIASKPTAASKEKRIGAKKIKSETKEGRRKIRHND